LRGGSLSGAKEVRGIYFYLKATLKTKIPPCGKALGCQSEVSCFGQVGGSPCTAAGSRCPARVRAGAVLLVNSAKLAVHDAAFPPFSEDQSGWIESQPSADKQVTGLVCTSSLLVIHCVTDPSGFPSFCPYTLDTAGHDFSL